MENFTKLKKILITGGAKRVGAAIAEHFLNTYPHIETLYLHYNQSVEQAKLFQQKYPSKIQLIKCDFRDEDEIIKLAQAAKEAELLINNAAYFKNDSFDNLSLSNLSNHFQINVFAPLLLIKELVKYNNLKLALNILDANSGNDKNCDFISYNLSKESFRAATKIAACNQQKALRINGLALGFIQKPDAMNPERFSEIINRNPQNKTSQFENLFNCLDMIWKNNRINSEIFEIE